MFLFFSIQYYCIHIITPWHYCMPFAFDRFPSIHIFIFDFETTYFENKNKKANTFNRHSRYPQRKQSLLQISKYIIDWYVNKKLI